MTTDKDLFGKAIKSAKKRPTRLEKALHDYDKFTYIDRLRRLTYINKIYPKGLMLAGDMEFVFTFGEVKECFISGHFIATIILAQSFIEKIIHGFFTSKNLEKETKFGLDNMIKFARKNNLIHPTILDKADILRLKRNPFTHSKDWNYPQSLSHRSFDNNIKPSDQLEKDATESIQIMFYLATHKL
jgi:hypothetical protein